MKKIIAIVLVLVFALAMFTGCKDDGTIKPKVLKVQLNPARDAEKMEAQRKPLQDLLSEKLGMDVEVTVATDYNALIEAMASEQVHVGMLATTQYVLAADEGHAEAILASLRYDVNDDGSPMLDKPLVAGYYSQLIVDKDSGITSVEELKGKRIAVSSFTSTSGFVWPANLLADHGLNPETDVEWINAGGHDNAVLAIMNGEADAAFTFKDARTTYFSEEDNYSDIMETCVFLMNTTIIPNDTISVIPNLDPDLKEKIKQAFLDITKNEDEIAIMRDVYSHEGYSEAVDSDYDKVREYLKRKDEWSFD
jgi:phosphonate transport system substrate-binding protein